MMTALATGSRSSFHERKRLSSCCGTTTGLLRVVGAAGDRALQRLSVGALEVTQRFGTDAADARVAILGGDDAALALVLDRGQLQLFAQDVGQLVERDVDLEHVLAGVLAGLPAPSAALRFVAADARRPTSPSPWPTPPFCLSPKVKRGMSMCGIGMETRSLPLRPSSSPCEM